jgi:glycosyltransferase involved in cell wall biosynthesis
VRGRGAASKTGSRRPVVVTPRIETATVVRAYDAGIVADGDRPEDLATALLRVLTDRELGTRLGANGRKAAVQHLDWSVVGGRLADALLARVR